MRRRIKEQPLTSSQEKILAGGGVALAIITGPKIEDVVAAYPNGLVRFLLARRDVAVFLQDEIADLRRKGHPINPKNIPMLYDDAFEVNYRPGERPQPSILHSGVARLLRGEAYLVRIASGYWFPLFFADEYASRAPGIRGHINVRPHPAYSRS